MKDAQKITLKIVPVFLQHVSNGFTENEICKCITNVVKKEFLFYACFTTSRTSLETLRKQ